MEFIVDLPDGGWDFSGYFQYLAEHEKSLPQEVFQFAIDKRNYDLISHQSLHDAWLERLSIVEVATGSRSEIRSLEIDCRYLGPYHDLTIQLTYRDVVGYKLTAPREIQSAPRAGIGHGDLLVHEVRLGKHCNVVHELRFSEGAVFEIGCRTFTHHLGARSQT